MATLTSAVATAKSLQAHVDNLVKNAVAHTSEVELDEEQREESRRAREDVSKSIDEISSMIAKVRGRHKISRDNERANERIRHASRTAFANSSLSDDPNIALKNDNESSLSTLNTTVETMADSIKNVMTDFNTTLALPGLTNFSATLESVPLVGILNGTVQYTQKVLSGTDVTDQWSKLDDMPVTPASGQSTNLFSYNGNLYLSVGQALYSKTPLDAGNPEIRKAATDNWSKIFNTGWVTDGDCLPTSNARDVAGFNKISADGTILESWLTVLGDDYSLSFSNDPVRAGMSFSALAFQGSDSAPQLQKIAYWNGSFWGYDSANNLYELTPDFDNASYNVKSTDSLPGAFTDFSAVDDGLVGALADGTLTKRIIVPPADGSTDSSTAEWKPYINQDSVTCLGAASPGVILDMKTLTTYLKSNYTDVQAQLIPLITPMKAYANAHQILYSGLAKDAVVYNDPNSPDDKKQLAYTDATLVTQHSLLWSAMLSSNIDAASQAIVAMKDQIGSIGSSIDAQLAEIQTSLEALNATLKTQEEFFDTMNALMWGSVAGMVAGLGLLIAGFLFPGAAPVLFLAGGALFLGGAVGAIAFGIEVGVAADAVASTKSQIQAQTEAQSQLLAIKGAFGNLDTEYASMNSFWGAMKTDASNLTTYDQFGADILIDPSSIAAAQVVSGDISTNIDAYLSVLYGQGIHEQSDPVAARLPAGLEVIDPEILNKRVEDIARDEATRRVAKLNCVARITDHAIEELKKGRVDSYLSHLTKAAKLHEFVHKKSIPIFV